MLGPVFGPALKGAHKTIMEPVEHLTLSFIRSHLEEAARLIEERDASEALQILTPLPNDGIAPVLEAVQPYTAARLLRALPHAQALDVTTSLSASALLGVLRQLSSEERTPFIEALDPATGQMLRRALTYHERSAGSLADPAVLTFPPDLSVEDALERVRREPHRAHTYLCVLDEEARLFGVVSLKDLITAYPHERLSSLVETDVVTLSAELREEDLLVHPSWRRFHRLPVVDRAGGFIGMLAYRRLAWLEETPPDPSLEATIPEILIQLWEASALAGLRLFSDLVQTRAPETPSARERGRQERNERP